MDWVLPFYKKLWSADASEATGEVAFHQRITIQRRIYEPLTILSTVL
jgi:hypothetical protein